MAPEILEPRYLLAGNVTVLVRGGSLFLSGDGEANEVALLRDGSDLIVEGRNATRVNGGSVRFQVPNSQVTRDIQGNFKGGNDQLTVRGITIPGTLRLKMRSGNDRVELQDVTAGAVMLDTDRGDDVVQLERVTTTGNLWVFLGTGNDALGQSNVTVGGSLRLKASGLGDNTIALGDLQVSGSTQVTLGRGQDQLAIVDTSTFGGSVGITSGRGSDVIVVNPSRGGGTATFRALVSIALGRGDDTLVFDTATSRTSGIHIDGGRGRDRASGELLNAAANTRVRRVESRDSLPTAPLVDAVLARLVQRGIPQEFFALSTASTQAPVITTSSGSMTYVENAPPIVIDASLIITDADSPRLSRATVAIVQGFAAGQDLLSFVASAGITGNYDGNTGVLSLIGNASVAEWQVLLRTVSYVNSSDDPSTIDRRIRFTVNDGMLSGSAERTVQVQAVDDPGNLVLPGEYADRNVTVRKPVGQRIEFTATVVDLDDRDYVFQLDLQQSGLSQDAARPSIDPRTGQFSWVPDRTGTFTIRVIAVNGKGFADQETFRIEIIN